MALVLKTREGNLRRFESCPFRQISKSKACFGFSNLKEWTRMDILSFPPFFCGFYFVCGKIVLARSINLMVGEGGRSNYEK